MEEKNKTNWGKGCLVIIIAIVAWGLLLQPFIDTDEKTDMLTNSSWLSCVVLSIIYWLAVYYIFLKDRGK